ncbi:MAG: hypothetical protein FJZ56_01590 [Chlamydiae bacterium]|nr:hypothetical protein [Chlamydiota bacterium]
METDDDSEITDPVSDQESLRSITLTEFQDSIDQLPKKSPPLYDRYWEFLTFKTQADSKAGKVALVFSALVVDLIFLISLGSLYCLFAEGCKYYDNANKQ